jgi:hypothetical protein
MSSGASWKDLCNCRLPIANCRLRRIEGIFQLAIGNPKSEMSGWLARPGSRKLGAKWVEVRKRRAKASEAA